MPFKFSNHRTFAIAIPVLGIVALAGAANAGGMSEPVITPAPAPAPVVAAPVTFGTDWTGFYAGGQLGFGRLASDALTTDPTGAVYGVHAGYLYDLGSWVLGGEIDYDLTAIEEETDGIALDSVARGKLRVGYDAGLWMPYLTGGVAQATTSGALEASDNGAFGGVGIDYQLSDSIRIGAEVLQHKFENFNDIGSDIEATTATARVSFQF